jgi:hypothetical protein
MGQKTSDVRIPQLKKARPEHRMINPVVRRRKRREYSLHVDVSNRTAEGNPRP